MKRILLIIMVMMLFATAEIYAAGGGAAPYLRMGVGARARGLGKAFTAIADDATANYYNPAGMVQIENREVTFMMSRLSLDRKLSYIGYIQEFNGNYFGVSFLGFGIDDIEERGMTGNLDGNFDFGNASYQVSYGKEIIEKISIGISGKYLDSKFKGLSANYAGAGDAKATGYGMDIGLLYQINEKIRAAVVIQDMWSKLDWKTGRKESVPNVIKVGGAYNILNNRLLLSGEIERESYAEETKINIGAEWWIVMPLAIRLGLRDGNFSGGLGFKTDMGNMSLLIDYAYLEDTFSTDYDESAGHQFSLGLKF